MAAAPPKTKKDFYHQQDVDLLFVLNFANIFAAFFLFINISLFIIS